MFKKIKGLFRLEEVKARIMKILVDRESVAKENNELKRYFCLIEEKYFEKIEENIFSRYIQCVEWLTGENRRLRQEIENIKREDFTRSD